MMKKFPDILVRNISPNLVAKLKKLQDIFNGITLLDCRKEYSLIDEIEHAISVELIEIPLTHERVKSERINATLNETLKNSAFSKLYIYVGNEIWNPNEITYKEFMIKNLEHGDVKIISKEDSTYCIYEHFTRIGF